MSDTYVTRARMALLDALGDTEDDWSTEQPLLDAYTLLVLTRGEHVTQTDVHEAWAICRQRTRPAHPDLLPFDELTDEVKAYDEPYRVAIFRAAARLAVKPGEIVHACPGRGEDVTQCCGRPVMSLPMWGSRITLDPMLVTCPGRSSEVAS